MLAERTRFAPSPTGSLHLGSARTALYCYLLAKASGGAFLLRIEDTDKERSSLQSERQIFTALEWLGLSPDEAPVRQSERSAHYLKAAQSLLRQGLAYRCSCGSERLEALRDRQMKQGLKPRYDGLCRPDAPKADLEPLTPNGRFVVRFRNPTEGQVILNDSVRGRMVFENSELDDLILIRSDGGASYNFCVVVDDAFMGVTTVIRGDDHINNTPRQMNVFDALGYAVPRFAHLPMIMGQDGKRMSKRTGSVNVLDFKEQGIPAHAVLNYLLRLGWAQGDRERFSKAQMQQCFALAGVQRSPARFDPAKLMWFSEHTLREQSLEQHIEAMQGLYDAPQELTLERLGATLEKEQSPYHIEEILQAWRLIKVCSKDKDDSARCAAVLTENQSRSRDYHTLLIKSGAFFLKPQRYSDKAQAQLRAADARWLHAVAELASELAKAYCDDWGQQVGATEIKSLLETLAQEHGIRFATLAQTLRAALFGHTASPAIDRALMLLPPSEVVQRLHAAACIVA